MSGPLELKAINYRTTSLEEKEVETKSKMEIVVDLKNTCLSSSGFARDLNFCRGSKEKPREEKERVLYRIVSYIWPAIHKIF